MAKKIIITAEEYACVKKELVKPKNKSKLIQDRLLVIKYRYEGLSNKKIKAILGYSVYHISKQCADFKENGIHEYIRNKYIGPNRYISKEEEKEILKEFEILFEAGNMVDVEEIKMAFDKRLGFETSTSYIYKLLKRHGYRKIKPRSVHPKKASEEDIEASKKLTQID